MDRSTFRLVLLISFAHALVHIFELALPSVEQMIGEEYGVGKDKTGMLGTAWRVPFGGGAFLAGLLADRYGSKLLLIIYLVGCITTSLLLLCDLSFGILFGIMFTMGCFASIYHPAGLSLISRITSKETLPGALGWHGVIGSVGISSAPLLAAMVFGFGSVSWPVYYAVLCVPAFLIAVALYLWPSEPNVQVATSDGGATAQESQTDDTEFQLLPYALLVSVGVLGGIVYAAFMHFLPRYVSSVKLDFFDMPPESFRNVLASVVLVFAIAGQAIAGKIARPGKLEWLLCWILLGNVPFLAWMAFADGYARLVAPCLLALVHFMNQPVYNSLIAQYIPASRRSMGYGFSNMLCFGLGALGPTYAGQMETDALTYGGLAIVMTIAAMICFGLAVRQKRQFSATI